MAIHLKQIASQPILHYKFAGRITLQDLNDLDLAEQAFIAGLPTDSPYHVIADMHEVETIGAPLFPKLQQTRLAYDNRIEKIIVIGANPYLRALAISLGMNAQRNNIVFCDTFEAALAAINDSSVSNMSSSIV